MHTLTPPEPAAGPTGPLSLAQEQLWFLDQLAPGTTTYTVLQVWRLHGPLRVDLLRRAIDLVVARHAVLRATVRDDDGTPYQVVAAPAEVPLPVTDLRALPAAERERCLQAEIDTRRAQPYDLGAGPLCRFALLRMDDEQYVFCQGFHHLVTDGWSAAVINAELGTAYRALHAGVEPVFPDMELDFPEFAAAQRERLRDDELAGELTYWRHLLDGLPVLELPADRPRPTGGDATGGTLVQALPEDLHGLVRGLAGARGVSVFMVLAAAFDLVLSRYSGLEDVPVGVPMLGRPEPELEAVVGMFVNMVVLRTDLSGDPTFAELVDRVADRSLDLYEHQEVSFNQVVDAVQPVRDPDRNPLFQVSLQLLGGSNSGESLDLPGMSAEYVPMTSLRSRFDVALTVVDTGSSLRAMVEYCSDMFDRWRIEAMLSHLETVLRTAAADPHRRLSQLPIVSGAEAEALAAGPVRVLDRWGNLLPRGIVGELAVPAGTENMGGEPAGAGPGMRRSGERARWTADLRLERLGLVDGSEPVAVEDLTDQAASGAADDEPRTGTEHTVADIFAAVLAVPSIGAGVNFFDVGGNSLQAMRVVSRINKGFGIKLSVRTFFRAGSVRAISDVVDQAVAGDAR